MSTVIFEIPRSDIHVLRTALALAHAEMQRRIKRNQKAGKSYAPYMMEAGDYARLYELLGDRLKKER